MQKFLMFLMINFNENNFLKNENLKKYCTFKIGGNAKFLFVANSIKSLIDVCQYCKEHNIKFKIIGFGANLLFDDLGYNGAIIINKTNKIVFKNNFAYTDSGVAISKLINKCILKNLSGPEKLAGIPSTVGGGVVNSLGAFDVNLSDFVDYVECYKLDDLTKKLRLSKEECCFGYRSSIFKNGNFLITKVKFNFQPKSNVAIRENMISALEQKSATQPLNFPSAGSIFKRCKIIPAKVIDSLGLKGKRIGGAEISSKHAGFIINTDNASSNDVKQLIDEIQQKVKEKTNVTLEKEIEFVEY